MCSFVTMIVDLTGAPKMPFLDKIMIINICTDQTHIIIIIMIINTILNEPIIFYINPVIL